MNDDLNSQSNIDETESLAERTPEQTTPPPHVPLNPPATSSYPGFKDLLKQSLDIYKKHFFKFIRILVLLVLVALAFLLLPFNSMEGSGSTPNISFLITTQLISNLVGIFVALWLVFAIKQALDTGDVIIKEAFRSTLRNLFPYIWVGLLVYFIALPGFFLLIIPGVILAVHLSMSHLVLVDENIKGLNAVIKSMDYVKGKAFWVIGNFIVLTILALVTFVPIMLLFAGFGEFFYGIAISLISVLISPIPWIFAFLMFRALKAAKGSYIPAPTRKRRIKFALLALIGFVALPVIFGGLLLSTLNPNEQLQKARDSKRESDILMMSNALNTYFTDNQEYPASLNELTPRYFSYVPVDPLSGKSYTYSATTGTGENYKLCANEMEVSEKFCKDSFIPSRIYDTVK
ncbi:MAG: hypothetical protein UU80_C0017G0037 [candidate division WWE3 bacterium GW2011_GWA1_41_8]|uniref:Type II secretion system protein GspG C-terminal domain-containing protein n=2 Tax=Katanobacteria TaxID=422282 RepID=A0A0G0ZIQ9_UNCKA|nr:MAG: hypothetical protein UU72_C0013G0009 [candidate division WWE3 bacterium GW2011_GWB1_41_6]KKS21936.1 MAG: hypothetical protein UU80_C0017G0037 [candidate division WWE3 bacterium GW2011_GWA1_41_8]